MRLLARNAPHEIKCAKCGELATQINAWEIEPLCGDCAKDFDDDLLLALTNSPRCGECAYEGEEDKWTFDSKI